MDMVELRAIDWDEAAMILQEGYFNHNQRNQWGQTVLHIASSRPGDNVELVKVMLQQGASCDMADYQGRTCLHYSSGAGNVAITRVLLVAGANPVCRDVDGKCSLDNAVVYGHIGVLVLLILHGADVNVSDQHGTTALHFVRGACAVNTLLHAGADVEARGRKNETPLHTACATGREETISALLVQGADATATNLFDYTPLHVLTINGGDNVQPVELVLSKGASVNARGHQGRTPLHFSAQKGLRGVTMRLLSAGADPTLRDNAGKSFLDYIVVERHEELLRVVLARGKIDLNAANIYGFTALHHATRATIIRLLVGAGADINARTYLGRTPLLQYCQRNNGGTTIMSPPIWTFINQGADAAAKDNLGYTPLHFANSPVVVAVLVEAGANIDARTTKNITPLMESCRIDNTGVAFTLLNAGADPTTADILGTTALHFAANPGIVDALVQNGANVNARTSAGDTPLMWAFENIRVVQAVIAHGADVNSQNKKGRTVLHEVCREALYDDNTALVFVTDLLLRAGADETIVDIWHRLPMDGFPPPSYGFSTLRAVGSLLRLAPTERSLRRRILLLLCMKHLRETVVGWGSWLVFCKSETPGIFRKVVCYL